VHYLSSIFLAWRTSLIVVSAHIFGNGVDFGNNECYMSQEPLSHKISPILAGRKEFAFPRRGGVSREPARKKRLPAPFCSLAKFLIVSASFHSLHLMIIKVLAASFLLD
jgi:hypothetical protein